MKNWLLLEEGWSTIEVLDDDDILMLVLWNTTVIFTAVNKHTDYLPPNDHCWVQRRKRNEGVNLVPDFRIHPSLSCLHILCIKRPREQEGRKTPRKKEVVSQWVQTQFFLLHYFSVHNINLFPPFYLSYHIYSILFYAMPIPSIVDYLYT